MLARARHRAPGLAFLESDAATHDFKAQYDLLFSRFGVMFFADPDNAFLNSEFFEFSSRTQLNYIELSNSNVGF
jgi:trans-aconitate methyltransferase